MRSGLRYPHIMARVFNRPLLLMPDKADIIGRVLLEREDLAHADLSGIVILTDGDEPKMVSERGADIERDGYFVKDEIAVIPICGTLVHKLGGVRPYSGMLGYDSIRTNYIAALKDEAVEGILLDVDSPGGEVAGCFDLVDALYAAREIKPVRAAVNELCGSGAMAIASIAPRITIARTALAGSIGVYFLHADFSEAYDKLGVKFTIIKDGDLKGQGLSEFPLSDEAFDRIQKQVRDTGTIFKNTIARNRGIAVKRVIDQQAAVFMGEEAVAEGLADEIMPIDQAFAEFRSDLGH
jgi:signal peptide peptidase SppA